MQGNKVINAGIGYTVGNYLLKGLSFLTIPIFARLLTTEDYGIVNTFGAYESIMFVVIGLAIHTSFKNARHKYGLAQEGAVPGADYRTYVSNAFLLIWISGLTWLCLALVFRGPLSRIMKLDVPFVPLLILYSTCNAIVVAYNADVSIQYEYKKYLKIAGINSVCNILLSLFLILSVWPQSRYIGRIVGTVVPIAAIGGYLSLTQFKRHRPANFRPMMRWGVQYSLPIVPHGISQIILSSFDRIMIANMVSNAATGLYSFAYNILTIIQVTATSVDAVWSPWFYERRKENDFRSIRSVSSVYVLFLFAFSSIVMLLSPELVRILGGAKYTESVACVIPVVCGGFFTFLYNIPATVEYYHEKTGYIAAATTCAAAVNIIANYIFIRKYGYIAAAYTTLATYLLYFLFHYSLARKMEGRSLFSDKIIFGSSAAVLLVSAAALKMIGNMPVRLILAAGILAAFLTYAEKKNAIVTAVIRRFKK